jgi:hypothetical protein
MVEHQLKGVFYNCDDKYFRGTKSKEQNIFMAMSRDFYEEEENVSRVEEIPQPVDPNSLFDPLEFKPIISPNYLIGFTTLKTLKLIGYNKNRKCIILFDNGDNHNLIHRRTA